MTELPTQPVVLHMTEWTVRILRPRADGDGWEGAMRTAYDGREPETRVNRHLPAWKVERYVDEAGTVTELLDQQFGRMVAHILEEPWADALEARGGSA